MEYTEKDLADALSYTKVGVFTYDGFGCFLASIMSNTDISYTSKSVEDFNQSQKKYAPLSKGGLYRKWYVRTGFPEKGKTS